jgi:hypothetical protein
MSLRDKLGLNKPKAAKKPVQETAPPRLAAKPAAAALGKRPGKPPVVGTERVTCSCGHEIDFELFEDKKDSFRKERRAKLTGRACPACRQAAAAEKAKQEQEAKRQRREERERLRKERGIGEQGWKAKADKHIARLPDGSTYQAAYDGKARNWSGTLAIPDPVTAGKSLLFSATAPAVFKLLALLDSLWRDWLKERQRPCTPDRESTTS